MSSRPVIARLEAVRKRYGASPALDDLYLDVQRSEVLGARGCRLNPASNG